MYFYPFTLFIYVSYPHGKVDWNWEKTAAFHNFGVDSIIKVVQNDYL